MLRQIGRCHGETGRNVVLGRASRMPLVLGVQARPVLAAWSSRRACSSPMQPGLALRAALHLTDREHRALADGLAAFTDGEAHAGLERYTPNELEAHACVTAGLDARCADDGLDFACDVGGAKEELGLVANPKGRVPSSFFGVRTNSSASP